MALQQQYAYSFENVIATISGPNGAFSLTDNGVANEGITLTPDERVTIQRGAAGDWMYTLHSAQGGRLAIRVLKNGALNGLLSTMFDSDSLSSATIGQNMISVHNPQVGDAWTLVGCAFSKMPTVTYGTEGPMLEWDGIAGIMHGVIGNGTPGIIP
jgi:Protein of unknown function (DUF3277)